MNGLIRLKPSVGKLPTVPPPHSPRPKRRRQQQSMQSWFLWYIPGIAIVLLLVYTLAELFLKHMAFRTAQEQWRRMPETVDDLPMAPIAVPSHTHSVPAPSAAKPPAAPSTPPPAVAPRNASLLPAPEPVPVVDLPPMVFSAVPSHTGGMGMGMGMDAMGDQQSLITLEYLQQ